MSSRTGQEGRPSTEGVWAAEQGLEPQLPDPESGVLPLDDSAMASVLVRTTIKYAASYSRAQVTARASPPMVPPLQRGDADSRVRGNDGWRVRLGQRSARLGYIVWSGAITIPGGWSETDATGE